MKLSAENLGNGGVAFPSHGQFLSLTNLLSAVILGLYVYMLIVNLVQFQTGLLNSSVVSQIPNWLQSLLNKNWNRLTKLSKLLLGVDNTVWFIRIHVFCQTNMAAGSRDNNRHVCAFKLSTCCELEIILRLLLNNMLKWAKLLSSMSVLITYTRKQISLTRIFVTLGHSFEVYEYCILKFEEASSFFNKVFTLQLSIFFCYSSLLYSNIVYTF